MNTLTVSMGTLVDRTLLEMQTPQSAGGYVVLAGAIADTDTTFTLSSGNPSVSDVIELGSEVMLITGKSADVTPVYTVSRGYFGTPKAGHAAAAVGAVNPPYPRFKVAEAVRRSFSRLEALGLPMISTATYVRETDLRYAELPENTRDVLRVGYVGADGGWVDLDRWEFVDTVPVAKFPTGKILRLGSYVANDDDLEVTIRRPYRWSTHPATPDESATIEVYEGAEDLPASYAKAWLIGSREIRRQQLDRSEEWNQAEPARNGVSLSLLRTAWQDFYRALDEARRLVPTVPKHRPYIKMPRI